MSEEIWKDIPGWWGLQASSLGRIQRVKSKISIGGFPRLLSGCPHNGGYLYVGVRKDGRTVFAAIHRLVCLAFHGLPPAEKPIVRHLDGNALNNRPENVVWGTVRENSEDSRRHGTLPMGDVHCRAKLGSADIAGIFRRRAMGETGAEIAATFGTNLTTINRVIARKQWKHVDVPQHLIEAAHSVNRTRTGLRATDVGGASTAGAA